MSPWMLPPFIPHHRSRWPIKPKGSKDLEGDPQARLKAGTRARDAALAGLLDLLLHAGLPVVAASGEWAALMCDRHVDLSAPSLAAAWQHCIGKRLLDVI